MKNQLTQIQYKNSYLEDDFVGIKFDKSKIIIYLPIGFDLLQIENMPEKEQKSMILLLLRSIGLVKSKYNKDSKFDDFTGDKNEIPFNSFLWIIADYVNNGIFKDVEKEYKQGINSGKINWKRTLNSERYYTDNNVVFTNPYYETKHQENDLISELNVYCINKSICYIGFLFGNIKCLDSSLNDSFVEKNKNYYINILNKELLKSFNDRKKMLLNHMRRIISMTYLNESDKNINYGTRRYEYAWEEMVNKMFGSGNINIKEYFPESYWKIFKNEKKKDSSKLRPDAIFKDELHNRLFILDAKYYKFGVTKKYSDLPHTDSIQKQITYGEHIAINNDRYNNIDPDNIYNAFIIPYNKYDKENEKYELFNNIEYCGFAESDWKEFSNNKKYEKIALILVDFKYLMDCYYKKEKVSIDKLISNIEEIEKEDM